MPPDWSFITVRDSRNYGLSEAQCDAAFPRLWSDIERGLAYRKEVGNITVEDMELNWRQEAVVRAMIYDHQLYVLDVKGCSPRRDLRERALAVLLSINRAVTSYTGPLPNIEFTFCVDDWAYHSLLDENSKPVTWGFTRLPDWDDVWIMPDFGYWSWPAEPVGEYSQVRTGMRLQEAGRRATTDEELQHSRKKTLRSFRDKKPKVVWRGALITEQRQRLIDLWENKPWSDIHGFDWGAPDHKSKYVKMMDHCQWQYVLHTEGNSYSGRLKYLQNCHSVPVIPELMWQEAHHGLLVSSGDSQNYVQVRADYEDLGEKIEYYLANPIEAERIADNNVRTFRDRYLTPAAQACYWRKLIRAWREISFEPELLDEEGNMRGMPFETYV
ncbi:uncharacterized protein K452DRAFT_237718 [Aplosporella prunicola CBS 121167]|uniref:Glycosyl transferase CAP10 domain-containing protein n=1 Tax=Aplosporella prunicola CBS 121167 TaxID=1176127 RepID=A0A6A6AYI7_9PEZI|nr:uncharacterized protein K452DRAFT_237718 [Aplosporella prunicola CBS 121167]KAF2136318.1 hypothetical protein K452DRAFT_237718 [Aplosporella prunicola CBS 121167]